MLTDARFKFALESLKKCMEMEPKSNVFFSPQLIYQNLLVVYFGTDSDTDLEDTLRQVLYIPCYVTKAVAQQFYYFGGYKQFCYLMNGPDDTYTCQILSRILISESSQIFMSTLNLFSSGHQVKEIVFKMRPDLDLKFINNSINCVTQQKIQNVLAPASINSNTEVVIYNAIYCKGRFLESRFDLDISDDSDEEKKKSDSTFKDKNATESLLDAYIMEIPFKQYKISTFFFFPSESSKYNEKNFTENEKIMHIIQQMTTEEGSQTLRNVLDYGVVGQSCMTFPTFKIEQNLRMYELLNKLGLDELTPCGSAFLYEFSTKPLKLGDALHRINIEVTMDGTTAAACDLFFSDNGCQHVKINNNSSDNLFPCICLIYDKCNRNILFCGALFDS